MIKTGIYLILNTVNNKVYIGSAVDIKKRWRDHKWHLKENKHHNSHLQLAWNKYGENRFQFSILEECGIENLLLIERNYIIQYRANNSKFGYNINDPEHIFLNRKHNEITKQKLSIQKIGDKNPMFGKRGALHPRFGKTSTFETRQKMSIKKLGIKTHRRNNSKLTENDVINIRKLYHIDNVSQPKIAKQYLVSYGTINKIITKKSWTTV